MSPLTTPLGHFVVYIIFWFITSTFIYRGLFIQDDPYSSNRLFSKAIEIILLSMLWLAPFLYKKAKPHQEWASHFSPIFIIGGIMFVGFLYGVFSLSILILILTGMFLLQAKIQKISVKNFPHISIISKSLVVLFMVLIFFFNLKSLSVPDIDLYHDGSRLSAIQAFLNGNTPHKEIQLYYGILKEIVRPWIVFKLFSETYLADQFFGLIMNAAGASVIFMIVVVTSRSRIWAFLIGLILILRIDYFIVDRVFLALISILSILVCLRINDQRMKKFLSIESGLFLVLQFLYSFEVGLAVALGILFSFYLLGIKNRESSINLIYKDIFIGFGVGSIIWILYLIFTGSLIIFVRDQFSLMFFGGQVWSDLFRSRLFSDLPRFEPVYIRSFLFKLSIPIASVFLPFLFQSTSNNTSKTTIHQATILGSTSFFLFFLYILAPDQPHFKTAICLIIPIFSLILEKVWGWVMSPTKERLFAFKVIGIGTILGMPLLSALCGLQPAMSFVSSGIHHLKSPFNTFNTMSHSPDLYIPERLGPYPVSDEKLNEISQIAQYVQQNLKPDEYFFNFSGNGGYYFILDKMNPTRYGLPNHLFGSWMNNECIKDLKEKNPKIVLVHYQNNRLDVRPNYKEVADYIKSNYILDKRINNTGLWILKS